MSAAARLLLPDGLTDRRRRRVAYGTLLVYLIVLVVDVVAEALGLDVLSGVMLVVAMPLLVQTVRVSLAPSRGRTLLLIALGFAWLGDVLGFAVLVKIAFFLGTQIAYCLCFWPWRRHSLLYRPGPAVAYGVVMTAVIIAVARSAGGLAPLVALYGALLAVMVALASGINRRTVIGAVAFLVSDLVLGYQFFLAGPQPGLGVVVMSTYLSAQLLIVLGLIDRFTTPLHRLS